MVDGAERAICGDIEFAEHDAPSALLAMRGLFAPPSPLVSELLYAEVVSGTAARGREHIALEPRTVVSTNTYFGRFPASYWQRWTVVTEDGFPSAHFEHTFTLTERGPWVLTALDGGEARLAAMGALHATA